MAIQFDQKMRTEIAQALLRVKATKPCARCGGTNIDILEGFFAPMLETHVTGNFMVGPPQIPCAAIACTQCGHIWTHALGVLGLLNTENPK